MQTGIGLNVFHPSSGECTADGARLVQGVRRVAAPVSLSPVEAPVYGISVVRCDV